MPPLNICKKQDLFSERSLIQVINIIFGKFERAMSRIAIIDLGTNTFHLLIVDISATDIQILHKEKQSVKIGENGISYGKIAQPAQQRAVRTLQEFKQKMDILEVKQAYATATSAFRNAANGKSLAEEIYNKTGIAIDIINGKREAQLIYQGVIQALDLGKSKSLIMDIGGGSVEFIICDNSGVNWSHSFEIGAQRLMDQFHHKDPITPQEINRLDIFLDNHLAPLATAVEKFKPSVLVGASGTFETLSHIYNISQNLEKSNDLELPLSIDGFRQIHQELGTKNRFQRLEMPGMIEMRVDMIVVASCLINYVISRANLSSIRISSYALKEGVLYEVNKLIRSQKGYE